MVKVAPQSHTWYQSINQSIIIFNVAYATNSCYEQWDLPDDLTDPARSFDSIWQFLKTILFSLYYSDQRIRGFLKRYVLYKSTFYLLHLLTYCSLSGLQAISPQVI